MDSFWTAGSFSAFGACPALRVDEAPRPIPCLRVLRDALMVQSVSRQADIGNARWQPVRKRLIDMDAQKIDYQVPGASP